MECNKFWQTAASVTGISARTETREITDRSDRLHANWTETRAENDLLRDLFDVFADSMLGVATGSPVLCDFVLGAGTGAGGATSCAEPGHPPGHRSLGPHKAKDARVPAASIPKLSYVKSMDIT